MNIAWIMVLSLVLATLAEGVVEYVLGTLFNKVPILTPYSWALMYVSLIVGIVLCKYYQVDMIAMFATSITGAEYTPDLVGEILSGLVVGRGANYVHQFVSKFLKPAGA